METRRPEPFDRFPDKFSIWEWCLREYDKLCAELAALTEENERLRKELEAGISDMQAILNLADGGKLEISILKEIVEHRAGANAARAALGQQEGQPPVQGKNSNGF